MPDPSFAPATPFKKYVKIVQDMMSDTGYTYLEENHPATLSNLSLDETMTKLGEILDAQFPTEDELPGRLAEFCTLQAPEGFVPPSDLKTRFFEHPEEMSQRLAYSKQIQSAMKPYIKRRVQQQIAWDEACGRIFGTHEDGTSQLDVDSGRFGIQMMQLDDSPESRQRNERIVAMVALVNHQINASDYERIRTDAWIARDVSIEDAQARAHKELEYGAEFLVDCFNEKVSTVNPEQYQQAGATILSGTASPQEMEKAMNVLLDDGMYFMFTANAIFNAFAPGLSEARTTELSQYARKLERTGTTLYALRNVAELAATPEYAYLDPSELADSMISLIAAKEDNRQLIKDFKSYLSNITEASVSLIQGKSINLAEKYGFHADDLSSYPLAKTQIFRKGDSVLLMDVEALNVKDGYNIRFNVNVPGRYLDRTLGSDAAALLEKYQTLMSAGGHSSQTYEAIWTQLKSLKGVKLGDAAEAEARKKLKEKLLRLNFAVSAYFNANKKQEELEEEKEAELARLVKIFADEKLQQIQDIEDHQKTMQQTLAAKKAAAEYGFSNVEILDHETYACRKEGELLLLNPVTEEDGTISYRADSPGLYVDKALKTELSKLSESYGNEMSKLADNFQEPSAELLELHQAIQSASDMHLGEEADLDSRFAMGETLSRFTRLSQGFIQTYQESPHSLGDGVKQVADALLSFTKNIRERLSLVEFHTNTVQQRLSVVEWAANDSEVLKDMIDLAGGMDLPGDLGIEEDIQTDARNTIYGYITNRESDLFADDSVVEAETGERISIRTEEAIDKRNKEILAANVLEELLIGEKNLFPNENNRKLLQSIAATGSLKSLMKMVWNSQSFTEKIRSLDLTNDDPNTYKNLLQSGLHKEVAKDILKNYLTSVREAAKKSPKQNQKGNQGKGSVNIQGPVGSNELQPPMNPNVIVQG